MLLKFGHFGNFAEIACDTFVEIARIDIFISSARLDNRCWQFIKFINLFSKFQGVLPLSSYLGGVKPVFFF
ncbi:hypothetical protein [Nostoc sp. MS1]|uniref:hypothetical protein n=1 Tax=Nostoc sp. MS1 TaxID=2764711 RepID=UPI001CC62D68|nr:hypothetical protein [Nostoc sp. MS1]BCL37680.1 hypothetical protein NSMS1_41270 [Nostoc sp. MS1]